MTHLIVNTGALEEFVTESAAHLDDAGRAWARRHLGRFLLRDRRCRVGLTAEHMLDAGPVEVENRKKAQRRGLTATWFQVPDAVAAEIGRVLDWIGALPDIDRRLAMKRPRIAYESARIHAERWHRRLARADDGGIEDDPGGIETALQLPDGWRWVRLTTPEALDYEGRRMRHCAGEGSYDRFRTTIYSLRNAANEPHCTVEFDTGVERIRQAKGRANSGVAGKYMDAFAALLDRLRPKRLHTHLSEFAIAEDRSILRVSRAAEWPPGTRLLHNLVLTNHRDVHELPERMHINGALVLANCSLRELPRDLTIRQTLAGLSLSPVTALPEGLTVGLLSLEDSAVKTIAPGTRVLKELNLVHSQVRALPAELTVGELLILDGGAVGALPPDLEVAGRRMADVVPGPLPNTTVVIGDASFADLAFDDPDRVTVFGRLFIAGWPHPDLPGELTVFGDLDLSGARLGPSVGGSRVVVHGGLNLCGTGLGSLPENWTVNGKVAVD